MALFNYILHHTILDHLALSGVLRHFLGYLVGVWSRHVFWPAQPCLDLDQAATISEDSRFFSLSSLIFIKCLFIIATNHWEHCNAYIRPKTPAFMALFHLCPCDNLENLLSSAKLQNLNSRLNSAAVLTLKKKCSFDQFRQCFGASWCIVLSPTLGNLYTVPIYFKQAMLWSLLLHIYTRKCEIAKP